MALNQSFEQAHTTSLASALPTDLDWLLQPLERTIGGRSAKKLLPLGLVTPVDLLNHFPFRYATWGELTPISDLALGEVATVMAQVVRTSLRPGMRDTKAILTVTITDGSALMYLKFFARHTNILSYHERRLQPGLVGFFSGTVANYRNQLQLAHPDYLVADSQDTQALEAHQRMIARPIPIYHANAAMPSWKIRSAIEVVLGALSGSPLLDPIPEYVRNRYKLPERIDAWVNVHQPQTIAQSQQARKRFAFEEALVLQVALAQIRHRARLNQGVSLGKIDCDLVKKVRKELPFELTSGQLQVWQEIRADLSQNLPMQRLLQGEVGSGKTVIALLALAQAVGSGYQCAFLAPTEVLANQHFMTICRFLGQSPQNPDSGSVRLELLTGATPSAKRHRIQDWIASKEAGIIVGTHALLLAGESWGKLGLVVVDEQQRFGVIQREVLRQHGQGGSAHLLVMTATPIPRTIAMTVFGDLEVSVLRECPPGRGQVKSQIVLADNKAWTERMWQRAREEVVAGGRVFVVCPRIDSEPGEEARPDVESTVTRGGDGADNAPPGFQTQRGLLDIDLNWERLDDDLGPRVLTSVEDMAQRLQQEPHLQGIGIGTLHGRMSSIDKQAALDRFSAGQTPILVCTTVIEVGVDVGAATMMIIVDADRFGISQLHQLRGRVGRSDKDGLCLVLAPRECGLIARKRLKAFVSSNDGFVLAEADLNLRNEGDVLGQSQSGSGSSLQFIRIRRDAKMIAKCRTIAQSLVEKDPQLETQPSLNVEVQRRLSRSESEFLDKF